MAKLIVGSAALLFAVWANQAAGQATCGSGPFIGKDALETLVANNTVCVGSGANKQNQEGHVGATSGTIFDFKLGSDPKDPRTQVGTYAITGNNGTGGGIITYTYGTSPFAYKVLSPSTFPGGNTFCGQGGGAPANLSVTVISGSNTSCP